MVEVPLANHLSNFGIDGEEYEGGGNFPKDRKLIWGLEILHNFISKIDIIMDFGSQKVHFTSSQCLESFNFDHSKTTFPLTTHYFLAH